MVLPGTAIGSAASVDGAALEQPAGASGTRLKVAARPATVGATWMDLFQPGTPRPPSLDARVRVIADVAGALIQIHDNTGLPRPHRRHGRLTPRHLLIGVDGSASLFNAREPFSKLLPPQPDLGYLAPELLTQSGAATQQSDVFSLGVLLWEALDNGRLFPHRRAAAISRLIARRSLPLPRIDEEWAIPLGEVAMKALSLNPDDRYLDGTEFWLALREHMPPPDAARLALSRLAQRALKLELTTEIRENPPYLADRIVGFGSSLPPARALSLESDEPEPEAPARYSLRPERSSRQPTTSSAPSRQDDPAWGLSEPPAPRTSQLALGTSPSGSLAPEPRTSRAPSPEPSRSAPPPSRASAAPARGTARASQPAPTRASQPAPRAEEPPISTLHVNLPRELVDASLPFYVSSQPAPRPFPWGALSFAALIFFGVGAAVAFGAVTALRSPAVPSQEVARASAAPVASPSAPAPPPSAPATVPAAPVAAASEPTSPAAPAAPAPASPVATRTAPADAPALAAAAPEPKVSESAHKAPRRPRSVKPRRPRLELAPIRQEALVAPADEPSSEIIREIPLEDPPAQPAPAGETIGEARPVAPESLPFVEQPY